MVVWPLPNLKGLLVELSKLTLYYKHSNDYDGID